jgi:hypothetical protein
MLGIALGGGQHARRSDRVDGNAPDTIVALHGAPGLSLEGLRPDLAPRLVVISGAGHYPHAGMPEQFYPAVEAILRSW